MRLLKTEKDAIAKALRTVERMEEYKRKLKSFLAALSGEVDSQHAGTLPQHVRRLPQLLLTHFTNQDDAISIINDRVIKLGDKRYISLSALSPIEFRTIAEQSASMGLAFSWTISYMRGSIFIRRSLMFVATALLPRFKRLRVIFLAGCSLSQRRPSPACDS